MALYEYKCLACGHAFEMKRGVIDATAPAHCPKCGEAATKLPSSGIRIVIK